MTDSTEADIVIQHLIEQRDQARAERDAAIALQKCECGADEACAALHKAWAERDAAARDMRERAAMAVRNKICTISWPPEDGDELIDTLMAVVRALPDTPTVMATDCEGPKL